MKQLRSIVFLLLAWLCGIENIHAQQAYVALSDDGTTATFYYDNNKDSRGGMSIYSSNYANITLAVFDASFANYHPAYTVNWFYNCQKLENIDGLTNLNTDRVTLMAQMFWGCSSLTSLDVSGFKTDNVTDMSHMFKDCSSLTSLDVSGFKTDNVTRMSYMFEGCKNLTSLDVSGFKTDNVTDMTSLFEGCKSLTSLDVSGFKTGNVTNMSYMFYGCSGLTSLDVSGFKTDNVTNMQRMFTGCSGLTSLDVSGFMTDNVTNMAGMFSSCSGLTSLDVSGFKTDNVTNMAGMFSSCSGLTSLDVSGFKTDNVTSMNLMFWNCPSLTSLDVSGFKTDNVTNMSSMFNYCKSLTSLDVSGFKTDNVTDMSDMFSYCYVLANLDVSGFKTDNVTDMSDMFYNCNALTNLDVSGFKTDNVTDMNSMFFSCYGLTSLDVSGFMTGNVTNMRTMFYNCARLTSLDVSGFKTDNVTNMDGMFRGCIGLTSLDLSSFKTDNVTDMSNMFYYCPELTTIFVSEDWSTSNVTKGDEMFTHCSNLIGGNGTLYDINHADVEYARIDKPDVPGYFTDINMEPWEPSKLPYAVWCKGNTTLYFVNSSKELKQGGTFDGQTISYVWSGEELTNWGENESWNSYTPMIWSGLLNSTCTRIVFDQSFKDVRVKSTSAWFVFSKLEKIEGLENFDTSEITSMDHMFLGCDKLKTIDLSHFDTHNVKYMQSLFEGCDNLTELDFSSFDTRNVQNMARMFAESYSLTHLDLSSFETGNVVNMRQMFGVVEGQSSIKSIDMSHFDTSNVTDMDMMFYGCSSLETLDLSSFNTSKVTEMWGMFSQCSSLKTIYAGSGWNTSSVENGGGMFANCANLVGGQGTAFDGVHYDYTYAHIDGGPENPGYFTAKSDEEQHIPEEAIDLGLPSGTKWAPWNVGASKPEEYGSYYAWGETEEKEVYDWSTYIHCDGSEETCHNIGSDIAGTEYDVAHVKWGGAWKMPTQKQVMELRDNCTWEWTTANGVNGLKIIGPNGNSVFLPAAGGRWEDGPGLAASRGLYWSSTVALQYAYVLLFESDDTSWANNACLHYCGFTVRPVITSEQSIDPLDEDETVTFDDDESGINEDEDLNGNVIGNIFYNITTGNGSYDAEEGCIKVTKPTADEEMQALEGQDIFGEDFKSQFTGIVFKVPSGSGTVKVTAETTGNMTLKVKIGNSAPIEMELDGKLKASFPYNVTEPTYVYIYAGQAPAGVKGLNAVATEESALKIYGIEWSKNEVDGIEAIDKRQLTLDNDIIYNLSGQRLSQPQRGVNIINGKKVVVK